MMLSYRTKMKLYLGYTDDEVDKILNQMLRECASADAEAMMLLDVPNETMFDSFLNEIKELQEDFEWLDTQHEKAAKFGETFEYTWANREGYKPPPGKIGRMSSR